MKERNEKKTAAADLTARELVAEAKAGDQAAFAELYEQTSGELYRTVRSMVRDEDLAWDILQDSYVRAWRGLDKLEANEAFLPWLRRIAVNVTATQMSQKRALTFTDLAADDDDREPDFPDLNIANQPELALDRKETSRLVREILSELSEEQQLIVGMRYYEDMPINEIAKTLRIAPGTVKALLFRGRKRIEAGVKALEKQGVKLYGLSPLPFLLALLRKLEPSTQAEEKALASVLEQAPTTAVTITAMTAGQAFLKGLGTKLLAGALALSLIAVGGKLAYDALSENRLPMIGDEQPTAEETLPPTETKPPEYYGAEILKTGLCGDDLTWTLYSDGMLRIEGNGIMTHDSTYDTDEDCIYDFYLEQDIRPLIKEVVIEPGVTELAKNAFSFCTNLTSVTIPDSVTSIGDSAFEGCGSLLSISIPQNVTDIGCAAFSKCSSLSAVTIPDQVKNIGTSLFADCTNLTYVKLSRSAEDIGNGAFSNCRKLTSLTIPRSVSYIGYGVFQGCTSLESVIFYNSSCEIGELQLPDQITVYGYPGSDIERYAMGQWLLSFVSLENDHASNTAGLCGDNLSWAYDDETGTLTITGSGEMEDFEGIAPWYSHRESITTVVLSNGLSSIGDRAFEDCSAMTTLTIPAGVTRIGRYAFLNCSALRSVTIPAGVTAIRINAFQGCSALDSIWIPEGVTEIEKEVFQGCVSLTAVSFPESVTAIRANAFDGCAALSSVAIPASVTAIESSAFMDCSSLTSVTIPKSVESIGNGAFADCESLASVTIPNHVTKINGGAFSGCTALTSVTIPESVTSIGDSAFEDCTSLTSVTIPESVTSIGSSAFYRCTSLTSMSIPDTVTSIGDVAFSGCTSLTSVTIPDSVTSIDSGTFYGCTSLTSVTIPDNVTSIGDWAFYGCTSLTCVRIPSSVTSIGESAFGWDRDDQGESYLLDDFTLSGSAGSEAERYANENGIPFEAIP